MQLISIFGFFNDNVNIFDDLECWTAENYIQSDESMNVKIFLGMHGKFEIFFL